ncbi:hypothetical protein AKO1_013994 [Acrasis kona]|uniref:Glycosyl transferase CAP10 domain-containing protein n=1 Tax=Acrasis kona TaxID=1008807 RepID=A0AAW2Z3P2_9EUKA
MRVYQSRVVLLFLLLCFAGNIVMFLHGWQKSDAKKCTEQTTTCPTCPIPEVLKTNFKEEVTPEAKGSNIKADKTLSHWLDDAVNYQTFRKRVSKDFLENRTANITLKLIDEKTARMQEDTMIRYLLVPGPYKEINGIRVEGGLYKHKGSCSDGVCNGRAEATERVLQHFYKWHMSGEVGASKIQKVLTFFYLTYDEIEGFFDPKKPLAPHFAYGSLTEHAGMSHMFDVNVKPKALSILGTTPMWGYHDGDHWWQKFTVQHLTEKIKNNHKDYPWEKKIKKAVWRGSPSGHWTDEKGTFQKGLQPHNKEGFPRYQLCDISTRNRNLLDAKFSSTSSHPEHKQYLIDLDVCCDSMALNDFQHYVAIVDVDGNAWSDRFMHLLQMNSVVMKHESPDGYVDFFTEKLIPWIHYVPIKRDWSDLLESIQWIMDHPEESQEIIRQANLFAVRIFNYKSVVDYYLVKMKQYESLQEPLEPIWTKDFIDASYHKVGNRLGDAGEVEKLFKSLR